MQGKNELIDDILESAKKSAAAMINEATKEVESAKAELNREGAQKKQAADAEAKAAADAVYAGKVKLGELEAGKVALAAKRECVAAVYAAVRDRILKMSDADYLALMQKLIAGACSDGDEIVPGRTDKRITADFVSKVAKAAKKKLTLSKDRGDFECGVILRNQKFDLDFSVDALVADLKERTESDVAKKLGL